MYHALHRLLHRHHKRSEFIIRIDGCRYQPPIYRRVFESVANLPGLEVQMEMRNRIAVDLVIDLYRTGDFL